MEQLNKAFDLAHRLHLGHYRKGNGVPYIKHVLDVCAFLAQIGIPKDQYPNVWMATYLHDTIEDVKTTTPPLIEAAILAATNNEVLNIVKELTFYPEKQTKEEYINSIPSKSIWAILIKLADRYCNVKDFAESGDKKYALIYYKKFTPLYPCLDLIADQFCCLVADKIERKYDELVNSLNR